MPRGGARKGAGRKPGSKPGKYLTKRVNTSKRTIEIDEHDSVSKLEALGFDPIKATVVMIEEVDQRITEMKALKKVSHHAITGMYQIKEKLINNLLKYGYRPVPEKIINEYEFEPLQIKLTDDRDWPLLDAEFQEESSTVN